LQPEAVSVEITDMKQHILVVDDEPPIRDLLSSFFRKHDYEVSTVATGAEALQAVDDKGVEVVILDVLLTDTDGLEVLSQIKAKHPKLPVIMITGIGFDEELLQEALQKGAAGYISKTLPLDQLLMEVHRSLNYK
jgi:DNA-binding NtrC family response regulator